MATHSQDKSAPRATDMESAPVPLRREAQLLEQATVCGYCGERVSADTEARRIHVFNCRKHPASRLVDAHHLILTIIARTDMSEDLKLSRIKGICKRSILGEIAR